MDIKRELTCRPRLALATGALAYATGALMLLTSALAGAQERPAPRGAAEDPGFFATIGRWFNRQTDSISSTFKDAGSKFDSLGREAGVAARTTVDGAKDAAGAVARLPNTRVVSGHEKCRIAANGAPDCVAAADLVCKTKGFTAGKSLDMTTAEVCPPQVWMSGRTSGAGCRTETFVSRALCQ